VASGDAASEGPLPAIAGFRVERALGAGAHGTVYLAQEEGGLRRRCALKVFAPWARERWEHEVAMCARIDEMRRRASAPEIVEPLAVGEAPGPAGTTLSWIALAWAEAGSLADRVAREGPLTWEAALPLGLEAARALALLHREGLFHRDVKPANLLVGADGRVRLADFGLARPLAGTLSAAGSPAFAAPEVIAGRVGDGRLADVYSLGATLAYLVTGETMLPGRPDVFALERRGVPRGAQRALAAAMSAVPGERPGTMEALAASLEAAGATTEVKRSAGVAGIRGIPRGRSGGGDGDVAGAAPVASASAPTRRPDAMPTTAPDTAHTADTARPSVPAARAKGALASLLCAIAVVPSWVALMIVFGSFIARHFNSPSYPGWRFFAAAGVWLLPPLLLEGTALFLGIRALARIRASGGRLAGRGLAIAGIVVACLNVYPAPLAFFKVKPMAKPPAGAAADSGRFDLPFDVDAPTAASTWVDLGSHRASPVLSGAVQFVGPDARLAISAGDPDTIWCGGLGLGVSVDGGKSWRAAHDRSSESTLGALLADPFRARTLYATAVDASIGREGAVRRAAGFGVLKCTGDRTWLAASNEGLPSFDVDALALDPAAPGTLYAGVAGRGIYRSVDGAASWSPCGTLPHPQLTRIDVVPRGTSPSAIYVRDSLGGIHRSVDGGATFAPAPFARKGSWAVAPGVVYACEQGRVYASVDGGESWRPTPAPLPPEVATGKLRVAPSDAKVLYVIAGLKEGPPYRDAVVRSEDGGASWKTVRSTREVNESIGDLAISPVSPGTAYAWVHALRPDAGGVAYGASGVFKTEDGGATWRNTFRADLDVEAR